MSLVELKSELSSLPVHDRAALALFLLNSLDESHHTQAEIEQEWRDEAKRRLASCDLPAGVSI